MSATSTSLGNLNNVAGIGNWAEAVEEENRHSAQKRVEVVNDGIKTVIDYIDHEDGSKSKVTTTYKVIRKKVLRVVAERRKWKKFGASKDDEPGPNISTTYVADDVEVQFLSRFGEQADGFDDKHMDRVKGQPFKGHCRFCKSDDHWGVTCPYKDLFPMEEEQQDTTDKSGSKFSGGTMPGRYVPPSQRPGATPGDRPTPTGERHSDDCTVRITNLPEDSDAGSLKDDLHAMFSRAGHVVRVYVAVNEDNKKKKTKGLTKGFAFVTFATSAEAEEAIKKFNGDKFEHLILKVEWTKPSK